MYRTIMLGILSGVAVCPAIAGGACHAKDLTFDQVITVVQGINEATRNLKALQDAEPSDAGGLLLAIAYQVSDRASVEGSLAAGYWQLYDRLGTEADRTAADNIISNVIAPSIWQAAKRYADYLTRLASGMPRFGAEIRDARDRVRKLETLFSCAGSSTAE